MWQRFTVRARRAVFFAQEEAGKRGQTLVSTGHLLLGLIRETDFLSFATLVRIGVPIETLRERVAEGLKTASEKAEGDMQLSPEAKLVIDAAYDEARRMNGNYIGTEHLLLGLLRVDDCPTHAVLIDFGADLEAVRREVLSLQVPSATGNDTSAEAGKSARVAPLSGYEEERNRAEPAVNYGDLGAARGQNGRVNVEVAMDARAFSQLADIFLAKDAHGYRAMADGDQTMFLLADGTPIKRLAPPQMDKSAENIGFYIRVLSGDYCGYAGWIFKACFKRTGPDEAPFPPSVDSSG